MPAETVPIANDQTGSEQRERVASILSRGVLRRVQILRRSGATAEREEFVAEGLDVSAETRLSVSRSAEG